MMDPRVEAWIKEHCGPHCYGEQDENGTDLSTIRANLRLTLEERLLRHDEQAAGLRELIEHGRRRQTQQTEAVR